MSNLFSKVLDSIVLTDTTAASLGVIIVNPVRSSWIVNSTKLIDEDSYSSDDEQLIAAGLNSIIEEFEDPDAHKSFNTIEELFADLDKE